MADLRIEYVPLAELQRAPRNPKEHDLGAIHQSINRRGFVMPILLDERTGRIVAGHGRLETLIQKKQSGENPPARIQKTPSGDWAVPVIRGIQFKDDLDAEAYLVADNQTTILGGWNVPELTTLLTDLKGADLLEGVGFTAEDLAEFMADIAADGSADPDEEVPPTPTKPVTKPGDVWILGKHVLLCGDSTIEADVRRVLLGGIPDIMVTDPPYGVALSAGWRIKRGLHKASGNTQRDELKGDDRVDWSEAYALSAAPIAYVWHSGKYAGEVQTSLLTAGYEVRQQIIWVKDHFAIGRSAYHWKHEPCWYAVRKGQTGYWRGGHKQSTVWEANSPRASTGKRDEEKADHPTQKPLALFKRPIENHTNVGERDSVYDPFCGSGTALIAAERLDRKCSAIEIEPKYVDVTVERWEKLTGKKAQRRVG